MELPPPPGTQDLHNRRVADRDRRRAARACDSCRRQKEKCDGGVPCRRCFRLGRKCEFSGRVIRPIPGGASGAIAAPDAASTIVAGTGDGSFPCQDPQVAQEGSTPTGPSPPAGLDSIQAYEHVARLERIIRHYAGDISFDAETIRQMAEHADKQTRPVSKNVTSSAQSPTHGSDLVGVDDENFDIRPLENNITHYSGEFSHWNFSMRVKQWIDQRVPGDGVNQSPNSTTGFKEYYRPEELQSPSNVTTSLSSLSPRSIANFLVHIFFKHAAANYFCIEREWFEAKLDTVYERAASLSRHDVGAMCIVFVVFAIGTQYAYLESYQEHLDGMMYNTGQQSSSNSGLFSEDTVGIMFYQQACRMLPDVITVSSLESVQACLLLGIFTLPLDASGLSYIYLNLAVKLGIQNGMHRKYSGDGLEGSLRETRNRVWWTAYTIEKRVGIFHGRPVSVASSDVETELPVDRSDIWPSTTAAHTSILLATLHLNHVLGQMSQEISVLKTKTRAEISSSLGRIAELHRGLVNYWASLPDSVSSKDTEQSPVTRASMHLKLEYCLIRIFVGRAFIFPKDPATRAQGTDRSPSAGLHLPAADEPMEWTRDSPRHVLINDCIEASLSVIDTCRILRATIGLARASYTEFSACRASLLVIITQCLHKKTDRLRRALREGMSMLKEMSAGESARSEMSLIEALERAIAKLDVVNSEKAGETDYTRFKQWEQMLKTGALPSCDLSTDASQELQVPMAGETFPAQWRPPEGLAQRQGMVVPASQTPFFGIDGNFASFPQSFDEFSFFPSSW